MKKEVTLGNLMSIFVPIFVLIMGWGISINSRIASHDIEINQNKETLKAQGEKIEKVDDKIDKNFKEMQLKLDKILYHELHQTTEQ